MTKSREVHLKSHPSGKLSSADFELATVEIPAIGENEALIKNLWMSIDAGQRVLMGAGDADIVDLPPKRFELGKPLEGQAIGQVVESRRKDLPVGTYVTNNHGWREYFTFGGALDRFTLWPIQDPAAPLQTYLHIMSLYGAAAYLALTEVARIKAGESIWVSTAAGSTGSIACQIAKLTGCRVIGTTGSDDKVDWLLNDLGVDAAVNYKKADTLRDAIKSACPDGLDVYVDFVGGAHLEAAIDLLNPHGRIVVIGQTQLYDGGSPAGPRNVFSVILKRLRIEGFTIFDYLEPSRMAKFQKLMGRWITEGKVKYRETIYDGIERAVDAQIDLFSGKNTGKMLVKLGEPEILG